MIEFLCYLEGIENVVVEKGGKKKKREEVRMPNCQRIC